MAGDRHDTAKKHSVEASIIGSITDKKGVWLCDGKKEIDLSL